MLRLIARAGLGAVTHRAVAAEAGVSPPAVRYYFRSKSELIRAAFRHFASWDLGRIDALALRAPRQALAVRDAARLLAAVASDELRRPERSLEVDLELILSVAREPALAAVYREYQRRLETRVRDLLRAVGSRQPARHARILLAFYRGHQVEQLARPGRRRSRRALEDDAARLIESLVGSPAG